MMRSSGQNARKWHAKALAITVVTILALAMVGVGVVFTSSFGMAEMATHARALHWTNATLGSTGIARASVAQSVFFAFDERHGLSSEFAKETAIAEARASLEPVVALIDSSDRPAGSDAVALVSQFAATASEVVDLAANGSADEAEALRLGALEETYTELGTVLAAAQSEQAAAIAATQESSGRLARVTQFAITFLIPALTLLVIWWLLRRRMRVQESDFESRLDEERRLSAAKDEFIAGLSHELRTPLTTIQGFSELLLEKDLDDETEEMMRIINTGSADLSRMVADLLVAARIDAEALSWHPEMVDLSRTIGLALAPYDLDGRVSVSISDLVVHADPLHLRQIVQNLVSNALKHGGGRIAISARQQGNYVALVIADNGLGIPPDAEKLLFKRFIHRGRQAMVAGSVGLGLAVSRELAMRMGGTIKYNRIDDWTTFTVVLPHKARISALHITESSPVDMAVS